MCSEQKSIVQYSERGRPLVHEYKHEAIGLGRVVGRMKHEITNWKAEE